MVAQLTEGSAFDRRGQPFKRRNYLPALIVGLVLCVATAIIWAVALNRPVETQRAAVCNAPPEPAESTDPVLGDPVARQIMTEVAPAKLAEVKVGVLNASGQGGQAADVAGALRDLGFGDPRAENDPIYGDTRLYCVGQVRFGATGRPAAAAVWLVAPCVELFQDNRPDDTVDLALGTDFTTLSQNDDVDAMLASLRPEATAPPDLSLLSSIHSAAC